MVEAEVHSVIQKKERKLDELIDHIQEQLHRGMSSEASLKNLHTRMKEVAERAEKALAHLNQASTPPVQSPTSSFQVQTPPLQAPTPPLADPPIVHSHLEANNPQTCSPTTLCLEGISLSEFMEKTKIEFERLHADNAALKAALDDMREQRTPSPTAFRRQSGVIEGLAKLMHVKKEPVDSPQQDQYVPASVPVKRIKAECPSPEAARTTKHIKSEPVDLQFPSLPPLPIATDIPPEAASYSLPPKLKVNLALIKNPSPKLSVVLSMEGNDPKAPPMATYSVFFAEQAQGSSVFEDWKILVECAAEPLPMLHMMPEYRPGCMFAVLAVVKDIFGRYGPFSDVVRAFV